MPSDSGISFQANSPADREPQQLVKLLQHRLLQRGIRGPAWAHRGLATFVTQAVSWQLERWELRQWGRNGHLPFAEVVDVSPHPCGADFERAVARLRLWLIDAEVTTMPIEIPASL